LRIDASVVSRRLPGDGLETERAAGRRRGQAGATTASAEGRKIVKRTTM
jgi:hypothetical protein